MRWLVLLLCASPALACEDPICEVPTDLLRFTRIIDFSSLPSGYGVGRALTGVIDGKGAHFGERFAVSRPRPGMTT
ncbi:hypothetical protein [Salipiger sp. HF18]|uniref:hypothetical protein n=1 Tax=Salipiger sp. HF18 TaxID=2721557 RepID=UPI0020CB043C|nr:hypothetical protein [Salipiger sp. HF18]